MSTIKLFADDCIIYRKIMNDSGMDKFQTDIDRLEQWTVENAIKINPGESKSISFARTRVKNPLNYFGGGTKDFRKGAAANI